MFLNLELMSESQKLLNITNDINIENVFFNLLKKDCCREVFMKWFL